MHGGHWHSSKFDVDKHWGVSEAARPDWRFIW